MEIPEGLYKQKNSRIWWTCVKGRRETTGTDNLTEARRILDMRKGRVADGYPVIRRADTITCDEGFRDLRKHYEATGSRDLEEAGYRFKHLEEWFKKKKLIRVPAEINGYIKMRRSDGAADKTINNELEVLIKMLRIAYENNKLLRLPTVHKLKVNNVRQGFFEQEMFIRARSFLQVDKQLVVTINKVYGWRTQSEVLTREWRHIDLQLGTLRLDPGETKNDDGRVVYMTHEIKMMIVAQLVRVRALEQQMGKVIPYVFPHLEERLRGTRIKDFKKAWKTACKKAGCPGMRRHDFRRTSVRNMEQAGLPRSVAMKITGHRSESVYHRYAIVSDADLKRGRDLLETHSSLIEGSPITTQEHING